MRPILEPINEPLPGVCLIDTLQDEWWVVHTKSRHEKVLAATLTRQGIGFFLPLVRAKRIHAGRAVQVELPLFPGYLFMCGGYRERYETLATNRVANVIPVVDQDLLKVQLRHIFRLTESEHPVDLYPGLKRGKRCRVTQGCLRGMEGVVIRRNGACRIFVAVDVLGQSAELQIDVTMLEAID